MRTVYVNKQFSNSEKAVHFLYLWCILSRKPVFVSLYCLSLSSLQPKQPLFNSFIMPESLSFKLYTLSPSGSAVAVQRSAYEFVVNNIIPSLGVPFIQSQRAWKFVSGGIDGLAPKRWYGGCPMNLFAIFLGVYQSQFLIGRSFRRVVTLPVYQVYL